MAVGEVHERPRPVETELYFHKLRLLTLIDVHKGSHWGLPSRGEQTERRLRGGVSSMEVGWGVGGGAWANLWTQLHKLLTLLSLSKLIICLANP